MSEPRTRATAYADLVAALLGARNAPATEAFDAALAAAEAEGALDPAAARTLRYWQRASVAEVVDHAIAVLPPVLVAGESADAEARATAEAATAAWERARPLLPGAGSRAGGPPAAEGPGADQAAPADIAEVTSGAPRRRLLVAGLTVLPEAGDAR